VEERRDSNIFTGQTRRSQGRRGSSSTPSLAAMPGNIGKRAIFYHMPDEGEEDDEKEGR